MSSLAFAQPPSWRITHFLLFALVIHYSRNYHPHLEVIFSFRNPRTLHGVATETHSQYRRKKC